MAGALLYISLFLITVFGFLLFTPNQVRSITDYEKPAAVEERKNVTVKMAQFLEQNPKALEKGGLIYTPQAPVAQNVSPKPVPVDEPVSHPVEIMFQNSNLQFKSLTEYDAWVYKNVTMDPIGFIKEIHSVDNPELYIDTLKKVSEIDPREEVQQEVKSALVGEAKQQLHQPNTDDYHRQVAARALQNYLDMEKDLALGKKTADEILNSSNNKPE